MLSHAGLILDTCWSQWSNLFPAIPFWRPHGAVMTLIIAAALVVLIGKYCLKRLP